MSAATLLRQARKTAGLSQAELAKRAGTSQSAVARYESGAASPSVRTLERLLHAAGQQLQLVTQPASRPANLGSARMKRLQALRPQIERLVRKAGASNIRVFGSVARGEDHLDSDVDLLVDFDLRTNGALPLIGLRRELSELLHEEVDLFAPRLLRPEVAKQALSEAVPL